MMKISFSRRTGLYLALLFSALLVQIAAGPALNSDDQMYASVANEGDIFGWLIQRYHTWSSRSLIDLITILIVTHTKLWMLLNAIVITGMCLAISSLASKDSKVCLNKSALAMACFWLIPANMMHWSVWWVTGSVNYLWPVAAALFYWAVVKYETTIMRPNALVILSGIVLAIFSSFSEQVMIVNFIVHAFLLSTLKADYFRNKSALFGLFANIIGFSFFILSDGNIGRTAFSAKTYFPEFLSMGALEKAYFGVSLGLYQFFYIGSWVSVIFCAVIALKHDAKVSKYIATTSILFIMLTSGYMLGYTSSSFSELTENVDFIGNVYQIDYRQAFTYDFFRALGFGIIFSIAIAFSILNGLEIKRFRIYMILLFILSFIPSCMLGFSPTMYASQERVFFASTAILILLTAMIAGKTKYSWHFLASATIVAFFTYS